MLPLPRERMKCKKIWRNPSRITYSFGFPRFTTISEYVHLSTSNFLLNIRAWSSAIQENFHTFLTVGRVCNMVLETQETREKNPDLKIRVWVGFHLIKFQASQVTKFGSGFGYFGACSSAIQDTSFSSGRGEWPHSDSLKNRVGKSWLATFDTFVG